MSAPLKSVSQESVDGLRKRVGKACDRCRLKKSKCDGTSPCSRCRIDNAICVFGERKKSHDKVYPKGYVEMLEQQQSQLIAGLQETYRRLSAANIWPGEPLSESEGHPLTHDILSRLGILDRTLDEHDEMFEEDPEKLQQRLLSQGASMVQHRRGSISSDSDHSQSHGHKRSRSGITSPKRTSIPKVSSYRRSLDLDISRTASPISQSLVIHESQTQSSIRPSPLHTESPVPQEPLQNMDEDLMLDSWNWQNFAPESNMQQTQPDFTMNSMNTMPTSFDNWQGFDPNQMQYDSGLMNAFTNQTPGPSTTRAPSGQGPANFQEWHNVEVDFTKFVGVTT